MDNLLSLLEVAGTDCYLTPDFNSPLSLAATWASCSLRTGLDREQVVCVPCASFAPHLKKNLVWISVQSLSWSTGQAALSSKGSKLEWLKTQLSHSLWIYFQLITATASHWLQGMARNGSQLLSKLPDWSGSLMSILLAMGQIWNRFGCSCEMTKDGKHITKCTWR